MNSHVRSRFTPKGQVFVLIGKLARTLADVHVRKRPQPMTDAELDELVHDAGLNRVWAAVERATKPVAVAAE
jgi:hypothetical protein